MDLLQTLKEKPGLLAEAAAIRGTTPKALLRRLEQADELVREAEAVERFVASAGAVGQARDNVCRMARALVAELERIDQLDMPAVRDHVRSAVRLAVEALSGQHFMPADWSAAFAWLQQLATADTMPTPPAKPKPASNGRATPGHLSETAARVLAMLADGPVDVADLRRRIVVELGVDPRGAAGIISGLQTHGHLRRDGDLVSRAEE